MPQRRMISLQIVDTDAFLEMPLSTQALYFHLVMRADDEGFVGNPNKISKLIGSNPDELKVLMSKRFILSFDSGIVVIKHWLIHNTIRMDRFNATHYQKELSSLILKENKSYTELRQPNVNQMSTVGMRKLSKVNLSKVNLSKDKELTPTEISNKFFNNKLEQERVIEELVLKGYDKNIVINEIVKFISYWTEPNKSGTKQRWELEKTFEIGRRLATWFSRVNSFNQSNKKVIISI